MITELRRARRTNWRDVGITITETELAELETKLRPRLTEEFLATLVGAAKIDGRATDYIETSRFVINVFHMAGKEAPNLESYNLD